MPFSKPVPEWNNPGTEPPQTMKDSGWTAGTKPPADWFNWFFNLVYQALQELQQNGYTKDEITQAIADAIATVVPSTDVATTATANKLLRLNSSAKLPTSITGSADGNAGTASKLQTARTIGLGGDASGSTAFDGSGNITITVALAAANVLSKLLTVDGSGSGLDGDTVDGKHYSDITSAINDAITALTKASVGLGNVDNTSDVNKPVSTAQAEADTIIYNNALNWAKGFGLGTNLTKRLASGTNLNTVTNGGAYDGNSLVNAPSTFGTAFVNIFVVPTGDVNYCRQFAFSMVDSTNRIFTRSEEAGSFSAWREMAGTDSNVASATKLQTSRTLSLTGDATGSGSFDGSANFSIALALTAASVLAKLKTVDGTGSGLDADLLDGHDTSYFLPTSSYSAADVLTKLKTVDGSGSGLDSDFFRGASISTGDVDVYVNTETGLASNDGSSDSAYTTLQHALDMVPTILMHNYNIHVNSPSEQHIGDLTIASRIGTGAINFSGYQNMSKIWTSALFIGMGDIFININGLNLEMDPNSSRYWTYKFDNCRYVGLFNSAVDGYGSQHYGVWSFNSRVHVSGCGISNCSKALYSDHGGEIISQQNNGSANTYALECNAALIRKYDTQPSGTTQENAYAGGQII